jgi:hypothetical protein
MAWKMRSVLAAGVVAVMLMLRDCSEEGGRDGWKSRVWLPTERPETSAPVAAASHSMEETCWALRPGCGQLVVAVMMEYSVVDHTPATWAFPVSPDMGDAYGLRCDGS